MKIFRFDPEVGQEIEQFGSVKAIISKVVHLDNEAVVNCVYIRPNGKIGYHQAVTRQLFLLVEGNGWVRSESDEKHAVQGGQAVFWEKGEWHESGTETGMTAVIIEGTNVDPAELMPPLQEDEP
jgi:quercetin dioxygenase-like cupin family protein